MQIFVSIVVQLVLSHWTLTSSNSFNHEFSALCASELCFRLYKQLFMCFWILKFLHKCALCFYSAACCKVQENIWGQWLSITPASWCPFSEQGSSKARPGLHQIHLCTQEFLCPRAKHQDQCPVWEAPRVEAISRHKPNEPQEEIPKEDKPATGCDWLGKCVLRDFWWPRWAVWRRWQRIPGDHRAAKPRRSTSSQHSYGTDSSSVTSWISPPSSFCSRLLIKQMGSDPSATLMTGRNNTYPINNKQWRADQSILTTCW